jgi:hypothetical protein
VRSRASRSTSLQRRVARQFTALPGDSAFGVNHWAKPGTEGTVRRMPASVRRTEGTVHRMPASVRGTEGPVRLMTASVHGTDRLVSLRGPPLRGTAPPVCSTGAPIGVTTLSLHLA